MLHKKQYNNKPKPLQTFTNSKSSNNSNPHTTSITNKHSLHSKSTYFYKQWFSGKKNKDGMKKISSSSLNPSSSFFSYSIPIACSIALLGGLSFAINPVVGNNVSAEENYSIDTQANDTLSLILGNTMDANPDLSGSTTVTSTGSVITRQYNFNVTSAGSNNGYRIYVQAASGYSSDLRGLANPREVLTGVGNKVAPGNDFASDTWGYFLKASDDTTTPTTYSTVPENGAIVAPAFTGTGAVTNKPFELTFGAKFSNSKPADHYQTKVLLSLAADATKAATLSTITYMQDMTSEICANTPTEPALGSTKQLIDKRDQKKYWVTKLQDENCWMTQNLDYDLGSSLSAETSDVESNISGLAVAAYSTSTDGVAGWRNNSDTGLKFYNPGLYIYTQSTEINLCPSNITRFSDCAIYGWKEWQPGDDEHYLVGNYYSYTAATAGATVDSSTQKATDSICPKGWKLPLSGEIDNETSGSFHNLLYQYGFRFTNGFSGLVSSTGQNIVSAPLYFLQSGAVNYNLGFVGYGGAYWSAQISRNFLFRDTIKVNDSSNTGYGYSVRCVVTSY